MPAGTVDDEQTAPARRANPVLARLTARGPAGLVVGGLVSVGVALLLFSRWSLSNELSRDEGVYLYGGQQLARHGVAPYASIFDPKGPLGDMLCALGIELGRPLGLHDVLAVRLLFLAFSVAAVVALFVLARRLFGSTVLGITAAAVLASFTGFANDAMGGPDAKTPSELFLVLATWFALRRSWLWTGVLCGLLFLDWQPYFTYALLFAACALLLPTDEPRRLHWRAAGRVVVGVLAPIAATAVYFLVDGTWEQMWQAAFVFPLTGIKRAPQTLAQHVQLMTGVVAKDYRQSGPLLYVGLIALVVLVVVALVRAGRRPWAALADPVVCLVFAGCLLQLCYALYDFQSYPDVFPFLPYAGLGIAGVLGLAVSALRTRTLRVGAVALVAVLTAGLVALAVGWFDGDPVNITKLHAQLSDACALYRAAGPQGQIWALGYASALVLTGASQPDPYIYLDSGVGQWKIAHTPGGLRGWAAGIRRHHADAVVVRNWDRTPLRDRMVADLQRHGYRTVHFGTWDVLLTPAAKQRAIAAGVLLRPHPGRVARGTDGRPLPGYACLPSAG